MKSRKFSTKIEAFPRQNRNIRQLNPVFVGKPDEVRYFFLKQSLLRRRGVPVGNPVIKG
jgi:hypothetical protein